MTVDAEKVMQDEIVIQALRTELDKRTRTIEKMLEQREEEAREVESLRKDLSVKQSRVEQLEGERDRSSREFWKQMEEMQDEFTIKLERITVSLRKPFLSISLFLFLFLFLSISLFLFLPLSLSLSLSFSFSRGFLSLLSLHWSFSLGLQAARRLRRIQTPKPELHALVDRLRVRRRSMF